MTTKMTQAKSGSVLSWSPPGSGSVTQEYRSMDQDPKEIIYGATTHWGVLTGIDRGIPWPYGHRV
jgi:hypothetical protein